MQEFLSNLNDCMSTLPDLLLRACCIDGGSSLAVARATWSTGDSAPGGARGKGCICSSFPLITCVRVCVWKFQT